MYTFADKLVEQLRCNTGKSINIASYVEYYTFDLMGHVGLNIEFNALSAQEHPTLDLWHIAHSKLGPLGAAPWIKHLLMGIPYIERLKYYREFMGWAHNELDKNIKVSCPDSAPVSLEAVNVHYFLVQKLNTRCLCIGQSTRAI